MLLGYWAGLAAGVDAHWFTHGIYVALMVGAVAMLYLRAVRVREERSAWALLALGFTPWTLGWVLHLGGEAMGNPWISPGPIDLFWMSLYPFAMAALFQLGRQLSGLGTALLTDILTITLVTAGLVTALALPPLLATESLGELGRLIVVAYQVGDSILAAIAVVAFALAGRQVSAAWVLLAAAILTLGVADTAWTLEAAATGPVPGMIGSNALYPLGPALAAAAAWQPAHDRSTSFMGAEIRIHAAVVLGVLFGIVLLAANEWIAVPAVSVVLVALGLAAAMHRIWHALLKVLRTTRSAARERELVGEVRHALAAGDLDLHYQPLVDLRTGAVHGVEALLRWDTRCPEAFLPAVERTDLIRAVTDFVLDRALEDLAQWRASGHEIGVSINLAAANLEEMDLPERVANALLRHRLPGHLLTLEITEGAALSAGAIPDRVVAALDAVGVAFSIDDFGTGHSSLVRIARFPITEIKLDRSFVGDMRHAKLPIVATSITLAQSLGMRVVAEGVEDAETMAQLRALGCDIGQGYHFSKPVTRDELARWLRLAPPAHKPAAGTG
nr:EAL domain-containing protein [uncultured Pseudoxanthomonas sp.]